jgi:hypothetical protein
VAQEEAGLLSVREAPDSDGAILASGNQPLALAVEGEAHDVVGVPPDGPLFLAAFGIP